MRAEEEAKLNARIVEVERLALGLRLMEMEAGTTYDFLQGCVRRARLELLTGVAWARAEMQWAAKTEEERKQEAASERRRRRMSFYRPEGPQGSSIRLKSEPGEEEAPTRPEREGKEFHDWKALKGRKSPLGLDLYDVEEEEK